MNQDHKDLVKNLREGDKVTVFFNAAHYENRRVHITQVTSIEGDDIICEEWPSGARFIFSTLSGDLKNDDPDAFTVAPYRNWHVELQMDWEPVTPSTLPPCGFMAFLASFLGFRKAA